jgi:leucyl aminopeptidase (aminopeptidase T)
VPRVEEVSKLSKNGRAELGQRARVFVEDWAKVKQGERVVVLADDTTDSDVARAVLDCARATGADVTFVEMPKPGSAWAEPSEVVLGAMKQAQKCLSLALVYHDRRTTIARREHGMAMFFLLPPVPATLFGEASHFPIELCTEIGRQCALRLRAARRLRVVSRRGTDFSADLDPRNCTADPGGWLDAWDPGRTIGITPGEGSNTFPPGVVLAYPTPGTVQGVAVFEHHVGVGPIASHLAVSYENGRCVGAQGEGAEKLAELVEGHEYATDVAEIAWGTNPLQTLSLGTDRNPIDAERHSGTVHVGIGPSPIFGSRTTSKLHLDGLVIRPSIYLDGEPIMEDGHLLVLDLPVVREVASRFGDPNELLRERFPITPSAMAEVSESGPVDLTDTWVRLSAPAAVEPWQELSGGRSDQQLELVRRLAVNAQRLEEGRWLLGLYRFNVEFATPAGETCHIEIDHGRVETYPGPAPGDRLMTVRVECQLELLEELVTAGIGPVDANISGRLWVSGSLGTRVLTSCTFRLVRIAQDGYRVGCLERETGLAQ